MSNIWDGADRIRRLKELLDEGLITQEEYEEKRKQILNTVIDNPNSNNPDIEVNSQIVEMKSDQQNMDPSEERKLPDNPEKDDNDCLVIPSEGEKIKELVQNDEKGSDDQKGRSNKKKIAVIGIAAVLIIVIGIVLTDRMVLQPAKDYKYAQALLDNNCYQSAQAKFEALGNYKDAADKVKEAQYKQGRRLMQHYKYADAILVFNALGDYEDSQTLIETCNNALSGDSDTDTSEGSYVMNGAVKASDEQDLPDTTIEVGQTVMFGKYPQTSDGSEQEIQWRVLDIDGDKALLLSEYGLDVKPYDDEETTVWADCSLREWLNSSFIDIAFTDDEQGEIEKVSNTNEDNNEYGIDGGDTTEDKVFLLSVTEVGKYFDSNEERKCQVTDYARKLGADVNELNGNCWWWLRTPGYSQKRAVGVYSVGSVDMDGGTITEEDIVRPAMWVNTEYLQSVNN